MTYKHKIIWLAISSLFSFSGMILQSCSNDLPYEIKVGSSSEEVFPTSIRDEKEAIQIALDGYSLFYLVNDDSRSNNAIILPKEIIKINRNISRGANENEPLLYIVNFENDRGYAIVLANRNAEPLLAVSDNGNYDNCITDQIPGFGLWMENAISYAEATNAASQGTSITPDFPLIPDDNLLQTKSWNDTISHRMVKPQLGIAWGQGNGNTTDISRKDCEGFYFPNGICGCAGLAIAQVCAGLKMPTSLNETYPGVGTQYNFDWDAIRNHKACRFVLNGVPQESGTCFESQSNKSGVHQSIARLCKIIGNYGNAQPNGSETSMTSDNLRRAASLVFGASHVSSSWNELLIESSIYEGQMMIVIGDPKNTGEGGHAWVCDGCEYVSYIHYDATRNNSYEEWKIISSFTESRSYFHFNWGWNSLGNGWYMNLTPDVNHVSDTGYNNLRFILIQK